MLIHTSLPTVHEDPESSFPSQLSYAELRRERERCGGDLLQFQYPVHSEHAVQTDSLSEALDKDLLNLFRSLVKLCGLEKNPWAVFSPNIGYKGGKLEEFFHDRDAHLVFRYINTIRLLVMKEHQERGCKFFEKMVARLRYKRGNSQSIDLRKFFQDICELPDHAWKQGRPKWFPRS
jgi:hypothetical protein